MERLRLNLNNDHSVGLGDNLCLLSELANAPPPIDLYVNNVHNTYDRLMHYKKIFRIPPSQLNILYSEENGDFNNVGWPSKLFSQYYRPQFITVNGQTVQPRTNNDINKKFIAIAGSTLADPSGLNEWPGCRSRPQEYWNRVYGWIKSIGYEAVSVDYPFADLENKIEILAKYCCAIISYEGGMAHLSHMLKLPCFLVDWKHPSPSTPLKEFHCEFVHKTDSVYILRNDEELFSWSDHRFRQELEKLRNGITNNRLVNGECRLQFDGPGIHGNVKVLRNSDNAVLLSAGGMYGTNKVGEFLNRYHASQVAQK
jgi:hypothetical protein